MCLISKVGGRKSICDIVCYKVVVYGKGSGCWWTPIMLFPIPYDVITGKRVYWASGERRNKIYPDLSYRVDGGYVHVYKDIPNEYTNHSSAYNTEIQIYECVIKKGTEYWESFDGKTLAARKIRFVKRIG